MALITLPEFDYKRLILAALFCGLLLNSQKGVAQLARIPFQLEDNGIIHLKVKVNDDEEALDFVLDTGAAADLLDISAARRMGLKPDAEQQVTGAGGVKSYKIIQNQQLRLPEGIIIDDTHLVLSDLTRLNEADEIQSAGIIGYSLLRNYITMMDYENQQLLLYDDIRAIDLKGYQRIPFKFHNGIPIPQFEMAFTLRPGESFSGRVFFDSGAGITFLVNSPFNKKHKIHKRASKSLTSKLKSLGSDSYTEKILIHSLQLGRASLGEMPITLSHDKEGVSAYKGYLGILGATIIKRFNVVLDYQTKTLYLKPNSYYEEPFEFPVSGLRLIKKGDQVLVDHVEQTSPAYELGLRDNDQILAINDLDTGNLRAYRNLLKEEGASLRIRARKPTGEEQTLVLKLKRLL